jgi:uncharacterized protein
MLSFIVRILLLAFAIYLIRRFLGIFMGSAKRPSAKSASKSDANYMVKDPVCGMYMDSRLAVRLESAGEITYFCSEECKNKFLDKSPEERSGVDANG